MILIFVLALALSIGASFICSVTEAAIYSVPIAYVKHLAEKGSRSAKALERMKDEIARPIAAILVVNTTANIVGPSIAGWLIGSLFPGNTSLLLGTSVLLAGLILFFGEIVPKTIGVIYCRSVSQFAALPLEYLLRFLAPLVWIARAVEFFLKRGREQPLVSHQEVLSLTEIGHEEGALDDLEGEVIQNVIGLDRVLVRDVLTPRVVVFRLCEETRLEEIRAGIGDWQFSRVPLFPAGHPEGLTSYATQRDVYRELVAGGVGKTLREIARPLTTVPELLGVDKLLSQMMDEREHICAVADEHGSLVGIITLEDILEEVLGREIVDEYDAVADLRAFAKVLKLSRRRLKKEKQRPGPSE